MDSVTDPYRVIICGSRDWTDRIAIGVSLFNWVHLVGANHLVVVHGEQRGADRITWDICDAAGIKHETHYADWKKLGRAAGPIRNGEMICAGAEFVHAFKDGFDFTLTRGTGGGTEDCARQARKAGIEVRVFSTGDQTWTNVP